MASDEEFLAIVQAKWAAARAASASPPGKTRPKADAPGEKTKVVQLNVRVPADVKLRIEQRAAALGLTLAQYIVAASDEHGGGEQ